MTAAECIALAKALRPTELDDNMLHTLLQGLEQQLIATVQEEKPKKSAVRSTALVIPSPFDRVYWTYLMAMIDLAAGNGEAYERSNALYRESLADYARFHQREKGSRRG